MAILLSAAMQPLEVSERRRRTRYAGTDSPGSVDVVGVDCRRLSWLVAGTGRGGGRGTPERTHREVLTSSASIVEGFPGWSLARVERTPVAGQPSRAGRHKENFY
nr:uncharacterized protein LOC118878709 isoform X3 [Drosophila suzukii]